MGNNESISPFISRSVSCELIFNEARLIADKMNSNEIRCVHLIKAMLNNPSKTIERFFNERDIDLDNLRNELKIERKSRFELPRNSLLRNYGVNSIAYNKRKKGM